MMKYVNQKKIMSTSLLKKDEFVASEIGGEVYRVVDIIHKFDSIDSAKENI